MKAFSKKLLAICLSVVMLFCSTATCFASTTSTKTGTNTKLTLTVASSYATGTFTYSKPTSGTTVRVSVSVYETKSTGYTLLSRTRGMYATAEATGTSSITVEKTIGLASGGYTIYSGSASGLVDGVKKLSITDQRYY